MADRESAAVVWADDRMLVWGGFVPDQYGSTPFDLAGWLNDGAAHDPSTDSWTVVPQPPTAGPGAAFSIAPAVPGTAVWTGAELIVWGGLVCSNFEEQCTPAYADFGAAYRPSTRQWRPIAAGPLGPRTGSASVWTGTDLIIWGGEGPVPDASIGPADGAIYDPAADRWLELRSP